MRYIIVYICPNELRAYWTGKDWKPHMEAAKRYKKPPPRPAMHKVARSFRGEMTMRRVRVIEVE